MEPKTMRRPGSLGGPVLALMLLLGSLTAPGRAAQAPAVATQATPSPATPAGEDPVIRAQNQFGFNLLGTLAPGGDNVFISPTSVMLALAMTTQGAAGQTQAAMTRTLGLEGLDRETANTRLRALRDTLTSPSEQVIVRVANALWARQGVRLRPAFSAAVAAAYGASVQTRDFANPATVDEINRWVSEQTAGKIPSIVDRLNARDALVLMNAVYFKGRWRNVFDPQQTAPRPFHRPDGTAPAIPMMNREGRYLYRHGDGFQMISLPYGDGPFSMVILLPDDGRDAAAFARELADSSGATGQGAARWAQWTGQLRQASGELTLPRFKMQYEANLNAPLKQLGMGPAFDEGAADFSAMIEPPPTAYISEVRHKTFVEVNEEGTEAAAATSVRIGLTSVQTDRFTMVIDRPFLCAIRDERSGAILFLGLIQNPQGKAN